MKVLNKNTDDIPEGAIFIGRPSTLGNPYIIGKDGDRETIVNKYTNYLVRNILDNDIKIVDALRGLKDTDDLVCFCKPEACHGDVIINVREFILSYGDWDKGVIQLRQCFKPNKCYQPINDGIDHINIYSKGDTKLGVLLSNLTRTPFVHHLYGEFQSVEGFWYYCATGHQHERLRDLYGYEAKKVGRSYKSEENDDFIEEIKEALYLKLRDNPEIKHMLIESTLPFAHYYYYGTKEDPKVIRDNFEWLSQAYEDIRTELRGYNVIIAGSRGITDYEEVKQAYIQADLPIRTIVSGKANGVDTLGEKLAKELKVPVLEYPADWDKYGKSAGYVRNKEMAVVADALIAIWDGESKGTKNMIDIMRYMGKKVFIRTVSKTA